MAAARSPLIALLTDFGTRDWYVASIKAVILSRAPTARCVDISHDVPSFNITAGAFILAAAAPYFPDGTIFACVVDPGVGTSRPLIAARTVRHTFLAPDNGLLSLVLQQEPVRQIVQISNRRLWLPSVSATFHGRDIIAPLTAHLARGGALSSLGPWCARCRGLALPPLRRQPGRIDGCIIHIDTYGNLITNIPAALVRHRRGAIRYRRRVVSVVSSYGAGSRGTLLGVPGSTGYLELALREASAARRYRAAIGDTVAWRG